jgi:hypothetical protein
VKASCSMFSQLLKLIPRTDFACLVKETGAERRSKGLYSWSQFVALLFCQLCRAHSLREIEGGLKSCEGKLSHLGIEALARAEAHIAAWRARQAVRQPSDTSRQQYRKVLLRLWCDWERIRTEQPQASQTEQLDCQLNFVCRGSLFLRPVSAAIVSPFVCF